jgi:hypothetical protein
VSNIKDRSLHLDHSTLNFRLIASDSTYREVSTKSLEGKLKLELNLACAGNYHQARLICSTTRIKLRPLQRVAWALDANPWLAWGSLPPKDGPWCRPSPKRALFRRQNPAKLSSWNEKILGGARRIDLWTGWEEVREWLFCAVFCEPSEIHSSGRVKFIPIECAYCLP